MITLTPLALSAETILLKNLTYENLDGFYDNLPYRYNSVTDLVSQGELIKQKFLRRLGLVNELYYQVVFLSTPQAKLPILECLKVNNVSGGMLSSYLHDLDREIIEGQGDLYISSQSRMVWQELLSYDEFSFVFPASHNPNSRTSLYMQEVGFQERRYEGVRCFFNGREQGQPFLAVMQEFITAIRQTNPRYSFDLDKFKLSKREQAKIARLFFAHL
jgi:hypothetical protein